MTSSINLNIKKRFLGGDSGDSGDDGSDSQRARADDDDGGSSGQRARASGNGSDDDSDSVSSGPIGGPTSSTGFASGGLTQGEGYAYLHPSEAVMGVEAGAEAIVDAMEGISSGGDGATVVFEEGAIQTEDPEEAAKLVEQRLDSRLERLLTR